MTFPVLSLPIRRTTPFFPPDFYAKLREHDPVSRVVLENGQVAWLVSRHEDVRAVLKNPLLSSNPRHAGFPQPEDSDRPLFLIEMDAPRHGELRRMLAAEFSPARLSVLGTHIQKDANRLIDVMLEKNCNADLVTDFALPIPSLTICHLLGVPYADRDFFQQTVKTVMAFDEENKAAAFGKLYAYFEELVTEKEAAPADDLLGRLILQQCRNGKLTHEELVNIAVILLMAGFETTATMIALSVATLFHFPDQRDLFVQDMNLVDNAVEELLRFHTVGDSDLLRVAIADTQIGEQRIAKGEGVIPLTWSANRDPSVFSHPDELDIRRDLHGQLAFGYGVHQCIGLNLARMEMRIALQTLFLRIPSLRLAVPVDALPFRYDAELFGLDALPVEW